ncbi:MAG: NUDIX hydrolase [Bacillota bacterium]
MGERMVKDLCAGGLVFLGDKLVILKRFNGVWLFPKGHIDPGETPEMAALREVKEESGLTARILADLGSTSYTFWEKGEKHIKTVFWYLMEAVSKQIILEPGFFTDVKALEETEIGLLSFQADQELAIQAFEKYRQWKENP